MRSLVMAVGAVVAGCAVLPMRQSPSEATSIPHDPVSMPTTAPRPLEEPSDYTYDLLTPEQTRLALVFDDTRRTFLRFEGDVPSGLVLFDESGRAVQFTVAESTAIVSSIHAGLLVRTPTQTSYAQAPHAVAVARSQSLDPAGEGQAPWLPAELAAARADILRAQDRLSRVSEALDKTSRGDPSASFSQLRTEIEEIQTVIDGVTATLVRASFDSGSAVLALSQEATAALLAAAVRADQIRLVGGTDNSGSVARNERLARARALSMRRVLIDGGVPADKVHLSTQRGDYIATNSTVAGRAKNRRVDVVLASDSRDSHPVAVNQPTLSAGGTP